MFLSVFILFSMFTIVTPATTLASTSSTINANQLDSDRIQLLRDLAPSKEALLHATQNIGNNSVQIDLPNKKLVEEQLSKQDLTKQLRTSLESIPVTIKVSAVDRKPAPVPLSMKNASPNVGALSSTEYWQVSRSYTAIGNLDQALFSYKCTQTYGYNGTDVVFVSTAANDPKTFKPYGWTLTDVSNQISSPIPYSYADSQNFAYFFSEIFNYGWPWDDAYIQIAFQYWGNGSFDSHVYLGGTN